MTSIGTNNANIDAQLAVKRAEEEEQKKAQAAKLEAEKKAQDAAKKAEKKPPQQTKPKAEDVSIHTTQQETSTTKPQQLTNNTQTSIYARDSITQYEPYSDSTTLSGGNIQFTSSYASQPSYLDTVDFSSNNSKTSDNDNFGLSATDSESNNDTSPIPGFSTLDVLKPGSKESELLRTESTNNTDNKPKDLTLNIEFKSEVLEELKELNQKAEKIGFKGIYFTNGDDIKDFSEWLSSLEERKNREKFDLSFTQYPEGFCKRQLQYAQEDAKRLGKIFDKHPLDIETFINKFNEQDERLQVAFLHWASSNSDKIYSNKRLTKKLDEILTSNETKISVKAAALYCIAANQKLTKEEKEKFYAKLDAQKIKQIINKQIILDAPTKEDGERMMAAAANTVNTANAAGFTLIAGTAAIMGAAYCQTEEDTKALCSAIETDTDAGARTKGRMTKYFRKDLQLTAHTCALNDPNHICVSTAIEGISDLHQDNQPQAIKITCSHKNVTEDDRVLLSKQLHRCHKDVQDEAIKIFLAEKCNTQSARVMASFAEELPHLNIPLENKVTYYNQIKDSEVVSTQIINEVKNQLEEQYFKETNRKDFDQFAQSAAKNQDIRNIETKCSTTTNKDISTQDKTSGFWNVIKTLTSQACLFLENRAHSAHCKPTISQFVDMLEKEIFTAEFVANAGYKDVLIKQFSALNGDTQKEVLKTLSVEDKLMMRKKGLLPRRFWEQVDELVANKALEGGHISSSDARYLAHTASSSILYRCLTSSNIKLSEDDKSLFKKKLVENRYLKNINGQYQKA